MKKRNLVLDPCVLSILSLTALVSLGCGDPAVDIPDDPESVVNRRHPAWVRPISWMGRHSNPGPSKAQETDRASANRIPDSV